MALRLATLVLLAVLMAGCAPMKVKAEPDHYVVPYAWPGSDELCVQQPDARWSCIHLEDLRKLLGAMGKA